MTTGIYAWLIFGAITVILVAAVKPPKDEPFWALWVLLLGPIGLAYLIVRSVKVALRKEPQ